MQCLGIMNVRTKWYENPGTVVEVLDQSGQPSTNRLTFLSIKHATKNDEDSLLPY